VEWLFPALFLLIWGTFMLAVLGGIVVAVCALVSAGRIPAEAFGPWWDNTKTAWLAGIAVSFMVPFGTLVSGFYWFKAGRSVYRKSGIVSRPFWIGPPKPPPPPPTQPYPTYPPPPST
jgi:hypothetical protein